MKAAPSSRCGLPRWLHPVLGAAAMVLLTSCGGNGDLSAPSGPPVSAPVEATFCVSADDCGSATVGESAGHQAEGRAPPSGPRSTARRWSRNGIRTFPGTRSWARLRAMKSTRRSSCPMTRWTNKRRRFVRPASSRRKTACSSSASTTSWACSGPTRPTPPRTRRSRPPRNARIPCSRASKSSWSCRASGPEAKAPTWHCCGVPSGPSPRMPTAITVGTRSPTAAPTPPRCLGTWRITAIRASRAGSTTSRIPSATATTFRR